MRNSFTQLYSEVGASFRRLDGPFLEAMMRNLDALNLIIEKFATSFKTNDFELTFILSAKTAIDSVKVMGPTWRHKAKDVEFVLSIPWRSTSNFVDEVQYVMPHIIEGISSVFTRYGVDASEVAPCLQQVLTEVLKNPKQFQYPNRPDNF